MGAPPDWYLLLKRARWAGVDPWDLAERPRFWQDAIAEAMSAEGSVWAPDAKQRGEGG